MGVRVAINGFGRIGRQTFRIIEEMHRNVNVVAINDLVPVDNLAYLLRYDSVHRSPNFQVHVEKDHLVIDHKKVKILSEGDPKHLPWKEMNIDYVIESTGFFTKHEDAEKHLLAGAKRVILSAPAKDGIPTFVMGVNQEKYDPKKHTIVSNASCTTNCLAPLTKVILDNFGIEEGLMTTIHSFTAKQPSVDSPCRNKKGYRESRAASVNIIPSTTGAAKALYLIIPELEGKLTGMAFRVPTIDVSVVDLTVRVSKKTTYKDICTALKKASEGPMKGIIQYIDEPLVSTDFIGNLHPCIFDADAGICLNERFYKLIAWYDNEVGYANCLVNLMKYMESKEQ